jgi:uncharacterized protein (TIRG00374 family)
MVRERAALVSVISSFDLRACFGIQSFGFRLSPFAPAGLAKVAGFAQSGVLACSDFEEAPLKRLLLNSLKVALSAGILIYLGLQARDSLPDLKGQPPHWGLLSLSAAIYLAMVLVTFVRWYLLVRALEMPFRLRDAFRLGFLGYMFNFVSLGSVGGDLFRAIFIAREQPGRRAEAVATVVIDRIIGLYALFVVASVAVLVTNLLQHDDEVVRLLCQITLVGTALSTLGGFVVLTPGFTNGRLSHWLGELPRVGRVVRRLLGAVRMYRRKLPVLIVTGLMSVGVHAFSTVGIYLGAIGLPGAAPSLAAHFLIVPLAMLAAAIPVSVSGLGVLEGVLDVLYVQFGEGAGVVEGTGFVVGLTYRAITIGVAIIGFGYYLANRAIVRQVMKQVSAEEDANEMADLDASRELNQAERRGPRPICGVPGERGAQAP